MRPDYSFSGPVFPPPKAGHDFSSKQFYAPAPHPFKPKDGNIPTTSVGHPSDPCFLPHLYE